MMPHPSNTKDASQVSPETARIRAAIREERKEWRKALGKWVFSAAAPLTTALISGPVALLQLAQWWGNEGQLRLAQVDQALYMRNSLLTEVNNGINLQCGVGSGVLAVGALCLFGYNTIAERPDASKYLKTEETVVGSEQSPHINATVIDEAKVNLTLEEIIQKDAARNRGCMWPPQNREPFAAH